MKSSALLTLFVLAVDTVFGQVNVANSVDIARNPQIQGLVVLQPGTNDLNTCKADEGYVGGGFYVQDKSGSAIFVCPASLDLIDGVDSGDIVKLSGSIQNSNVQILTVKATEITVLTGAGAQSEVVKEGDFDLFQDGLQYGDLISYEGYVELWWTEDVGAGFGITDCDGNTIKGWWTTIPGEDVFDLFNLPRPGEDQSNWQPSYFEMVGFYEIYDPYCFTWGGSEFQPRLQNINQIANPCQ